MIEKTHLKCLDRQINFFLLHKYLRGYVVNKGELLFECLGKYGKNLLTVKKELIQEHDPCDDFTEDLMNDDLIPTNYKELEFNNLKSLKFFVIRYYLENNLYD